MIPCCVGPSSTSSATAPGERGPGELVPSRRPQEVAVADRDAQTRQLDREEIEPTEDSSFRTHLIVAVGIVVLAGILTVLMETWG